MLLNLLFKILSSPLIAKILIPAVTGAITSFLEARSRDIERRAAIKAAKAAKTVEELREASRRLSNTTRRGDHSPR